MICLLDADSLLYVLSYNFREHMDEPTADIEIARAADDFVKTILTIVQADSYVGVFTPEKTFRQEVYKYAKYKGERPERPDWFQRFGPVIKSRLIEKWGFFTVPDLEADDVICALNEYYMNKGMDRIICSPDKDLRQIPGYHYDYKKEGASPFVIDNSQASCNFWTQMLTGCDGDNVKGIPGLGPKKVETLFKDCEDSMMWGVMVMAQYVKYFGNYYGPIIYQETKDALQLMSSKHRLWFKHSVWFDRVYCKNYNMNYLPEMTRPFNNTLEEDSPFSEDSHFGPDVEASKVFGTIEYEQPDQSRMIPYHKENIEKLIEQAEMLDPYGTTLPSNVHILSDKDWYGREPKEDLLG